MRKMTGGRSKRMGTGTGHAIGNKGMKGTNPRTRQVADRYK